jgi:hypothetical protein
MSYDHHWTQPELLGTGAEGKAAQTADCYGKEEQNCAEVSVRVFFQRGLKEEIIG